MSTGIYVIECGPGEVQLREPGKSISDKFEETWHGYGRRSTERLREWRDRQTTKPRPFVERYYGFAGLSRRNYEGVRPHNGFDVEFVEKNTLFLPRTLGARVSCIAGETRYDPPPVWWTLHQARECARSG